MTFLPLQARRAGAAACCCGWPRPALVRFAHIQWSVPVLTAALCLFVCRFPVCDARRVECSRAGGSKLCGGRSARGGCIGTAVRYYGTAHGGGQAASRCAAEYIHAVGAGPGVLAGRSIVCDAGFVGGSAFTRHLAREARPVKGRRSAAVHGTCRKGRWLFPARGGCMCMQRVGNACCGRVLRPRDPPARGLGCG